MKDYDKRDTSFLTHRPIDLMVIFKSSFSLPGVMVTSRVLSEYIINISKHIVIYFRRFSQQAAFIEHRPAHHFCCMLTA